jgi:hypothetical protein
LSPPQVGLPSKILENKYKGAETLTQSVENHGFDGVTGADYFSGLATD